MYASNEGSGETVSSEPSLFAKVPKSDEFQTSVFVQYKSWSIILFGRAQGKNV